TEYINHWEAEIRAFKGNINKIIDRRKDKYDIQEQRERIKLLKLDNKERTENNKITDAPINIIDEWAGDVEGATDDL
ncbi:hypothetical protein OJ590_10635, partial [Streptococcus anginosus]|nr:hypothetical protein [Streptococcus anginosus]